MHGHAKADKPRFGRAEHVAAAAFLHTILDAADRLREAHAFDGSRALPLDARSDLLRAVELLACPDDKRLIQVALTPAGRRAREAQRLPPLDWVFTLLNGLTPAAMQATAHVLRVLAARLERYEREMRRHAARARRGVPGA